MKDYRLRYLWLLMTGKRDKLIDDFCTMREMKKRYTKLKPYIWTSLFHDTNAHLFHKAYLFCDMHKMEEILEEIAGIAEESELYAQEPIVEVKKIGGGYYIIWVDINRLPFRVQQIYEGWKPFIVDRHRSTGKQDMFGREVFEGDIIESQLNGKVMIINYGMYQAYCPEDKCFMDGVGFYASGKNLPDMPIGPLERYAKVIGNIVDNPNLINW